MTCRTLFLSVALLTIAAAAAGCAMSPNEVVSVGNGVLRAPTYVQAAEHCDDKRATPKWLGKAPAESGVLFQCTTN